MTYANIEQAKTVTNKIWKQGREIMSNNCYLMSNAEFVMIFDDNGTIKVSPCWGNIGCPANKSNCMVKTWYNRNKTKKEIYNSVLKFIEKLNEINLK